MSFEFWFAASAGSLGFVIGLFAKRLNIANEQRNDHPPKRYLPFGERVRRWRDRLRPGQAVALLLISIFILVAVGQVIFGREYILAAYLGLIFIMVVVPIWLRPPIDAGRDALTNFRESPDRCGACGYLRDPRIARDQCSECAWTFPSEGVEPEPVDWFIRKHHPQSQRLVHDPAHAAKFVSYEVVTNLLGAGLVVGFVVAFDQVEMSFWPSFSVGMAVEALLRRRRLLCEAKRRGAVATAG